jgi:hypothetical protein
MSTDERRRNGHGRKDVDEILIAELIAGRSYEAAGKSAGVSRATVARRMADDAFRERVAAERLFVLEQTSARLIAASTRAVETLSELSRSAGSERVRVTAARAILDLAYGRRRFEIASIESAEVTRYVRRLVGLACKRMPEDEVVLFLEEATHALEL